MREWNLKLGDPLTLTLAADARLGGTDYSDDQIWEISLGGGDPPALALQTTFGLRARILRLYPRFTEGDRTVIDPADFHTRPAVQRIYPNFVQLAFAPFEDIDVKMEYWVPQSQGVTGRIQLTNTGHFVRQVRLEWVGQLSPNEGQRMAAAEIQAAPVLAGQTENLAPVVFLTGGPHPGSGSFPHLALGLELQPGAPRQFTWTQAALSTQEESFQLARNLALRRQDAERARLELVNAGQVDVYSGDPEWDAAFALAQKLALSLFIGPTQHLPGLSFVITRQPDQGHSLRGDGSDYNHLWNGQSPLESYYLASLLLPGNVQLIQGLVQNFLAVQSADGFIDWKPGLAGQRSRLLATPLLASLAWKVYETTGSHAFLEEVYPGLVRFVQAWFLPEHDRDGDGRPEWDHPMQAGCEDHPTYSRWQPWSQGVDIFTAESVSLSSMLVNECHALMRMAQILGKTDNIPALEALADPLSNAVTAAWDSDTGCYLDLDRDTHFCTQGELLGTRRGPGEILIQRSFDQPVRLLVRIHTNGESTRHPQMIVQGSSAAGNRRVERLTDARFKWYLGIGTLTGERTYTVLDRVELQGLDVEDEILLSSVDYHCLDQSQLLPLWAGLPTMQRAKSLVKKTITNPKKFWRPYGIPSCARANCSDIENACQSIHLPWNTLIGEGLLRYGFRELAAELVTRLMNAVLPSLKTGQAFYRNYDAETGQGSGERNALTGLAPLGLFLETLGVRLISSHRVALSGFNPFPWPVTVKYRGITILRQREKSMVIFPDGQTIVVDKPEPVIVSLE